MYYFLYTSSDYYEDSLYKDQVEDSNICLICLIPDIDKNPIKNMKEFSNIITTCNCKPFIHDKCLIQWLDNSSTCPICRKHVSTIKNLPNYTILKYFFFYIFFYNYTSTLFQIANFISLINLFLFYIYTLYVFYYFGNAFYIDNYIFDHVS
jgi:hypothetical protein